MASKSEMLALHSSIVEASSILRTVSEQEKFQEQRENVHTEIIKGMEDVLRGYGAIKVVIVIAVVVIQIMVIKKTLKQGSNTN